MRPGSISPTLKAVEQIWKKLSPDQPFVYTFLDENLNAQYTTYRNWTGLVGIATGFSLVIACLGLFALSGLSALNRTKEIGIRKVMGASVSSLFLLLNKATFRIALLAFLLAMPFSWYLMHLWLQDFAYRIVLSWNLFLTAGLVGITIACMAVSYHSIRAALANPVSSLRDE